MQIKVTTGCNSHSLSAMCYVFCLHAIIFLYLIHTLPLLHQLTKLGYSKKSSDVWIGLTSSYMECFFITGSLEYFIIQKAGPGCFWYKRPVPGHMVCYCQCYRHNLYILQDTILWRYLLQKTLMYVSTLLSWRRGRRVENSFI